MSDNNNPTETNRGNGGEATHAEQVSEKVAAIDISNSLSAPLKQAIDDIVQVADDSGGSADASVLVRDGNEGGLRFLLAVSELEDKLLKIRIPPGKGIAGLVFSTGQPMAVSDVSAEGSFWSKADKETGFKTITLLATNRKSTRLNSSHQIISYAVFCFKKKKNSTANRAVSGIGLEGLDVDLLQRVERRDVADADVSGGVRRAIGQQVGARTSMDAYRAA